MEKKLADALANYVAQTNVVLDELAESHYLNGSANKQLKLLRSHGAVLIEALHNSVSIPPAPPAPAPAPAPAA